MSFDGLIAYLFLVLNKYPFIWMHHTLFINSAATGHLGCFQHFSIMHKAVINICKLIFVWTQDSNSFGKMAKSMIAGS